MGLLRISLGLALGLAAAGLAQARLVEQQFDLPVRVADAYGKVFEQPIKVTVFFDDARPAPRPLLLLNHGRAAEAAERAKMGRARYGDASRWLAAQGFVVAVPTRIGYGVSGGEDLEFTGACNAKRYEPGYAAAVEQSLAVLQAMRARPDVLPDRTVVMGQSFGGAVAVALAARAPSGVVAAINFAGGGGGNPKTQPQRPCGTPQLERLFAGYGQTARLPMLWVYTENDMFFGPELPREWFAAYKAAGGVGEFRQLPPHGDDGHALFTRAPETWQPLVAEFLRRQGFGVKE
jgi:dienelactone hydrolase